MSLIVTKNQKVKDYVKGLNDKKILITGASQGLGHVCAQALAECGASLALFARTEEKLKILKDSLDNSDKHLCLPMDLTQTAQLHDGLKQAKEFLGDIDIVLHVVGGGLGLREPLLSAEELLKLFTLNVSIAAEINRCVVPDMIKRKSGNLVHVCSIASSEATGSVGYNTVKAALSGYVRSLGRELASSGIIATGILPGGFTAPENSWERLKAKNPQAVDQFINERLPRKYLGQAEELIPMILLLCSEAASMMSGCLVPIDAGEGKGFLSQ